MRRKNKILSFFVVILAVIAVLGLAGTLTKGFTNWGPFQKHNMLFEEGDKILLVVQRTEGSNLFAMNNELTGSYVKATDLGLSDGKTQELIESLYDLQGRSGVKEHLFTIEYSENGYYYLKSYEGKYVAYTTSSNSATLTDDPYELNIIKNEDGTYSIYSVKAPTRKLQMNKSVSSDYFAFYESEQIGNFEIHVVNKVDKIIDNYVATLEPEEDEETPTE